MSNSEMQKESVDSEALSEVELAISRLESVGGDSAIHLSIGSDQAENSANPTEECRVDSVADIEARIMGAFEKAAQIEVEQQVEAEPRLDDDSVKDLVGDPLSADMGNIALEADELETLQDLVVRYDQVVQDLDVLNKQIESLLAAEGIKGCES